MKKYYMSIRGNDAPQFASIYDLPNLIQRRTILEALVQAFSQRIAIVNNGNVIAFESRGDKCKIIDIGDISHTLHECYDLKEANSGTGISSQDLQNSYKEQLIAIKELVNRLHNHYSDVYKQMSSSIFAIDAVLGKQQNQIIVEELKDEINERIKNY